VRSPADEFVEEFVGADRMIARLEWLTAVRREGHAT
jgi:ABC-type proline/glycine betaine transport system ATPase subunit